MRSLLDLFDTPLQFSVVDIGAALSEEPPYRPLVERGCARLIGFEPDPDACAKLNAAYGSPHRFFPHFVGDGQIKTFHRTTHPLTGSLYEPNQALNEKFNRLAEYTTVVEKHAVQTTRLDDIAEIADVDLIKIDVQGAELDIFRNAPRNLGRCLMIMTEVGFVEQYKQQPMFADVDTFLRGAGFQFHAFNGFGSRTFKPLSKADDPFGGLRQVIWADAIYVRDWMKLEVLSTEKLKKYAVLVHDLVQSFDLCHALLDEIDRRDGGRLGERYRAQLTMQA